MYCSFIIITPIQWAILGCIFAGLGLFMPRRIPLTISGSALITAAFVLIYSLLIPAAPLLAVWQIILFLGLIIVGLFAVRPRSTTEEMFPQPHAIFTLTTPIKKGKGTFQHEGITYTLIGPDAPLGAKAAVVSINGHTLYIEILSQ